MCGGVDIFQFSDTYLGVDLGYLKANVAKHRLDKTHVCAILQHKGCHRVAEQVTAPALADVGLVDVFTHHLRESIRDEGLAQVRQEQGVFVVWHR